LALNKPAESAQKIRIVSFAARLCGMPSQVKTPLLAAGNDLIVAAFRAFRAESLAPHDLRTINQCVARATNAVEAGGDSQAGLLADVVADLSPLRDRHGDKLPQIGRLIELAGKPPASAPLARG
jgi:hypothetical protein